MDTNKLKAIIQSDRQCVQLFADNRSEECAKRVTELAPPIRKQLPLSQMGVLSLYESQIEVGEFVLQRMDQIALVNPVVRRLWKFMDAGSATESLPDFSAPGIRAALTTDQSQGGLGLTLEQAKPILDAGEQPDETTHVQIFELKEREQWHPTYAAN